MQQRMFVLVSYIVLIFSFLVLICNIEKFIFVVVLSFVFRGVWGKHTN